MADEDSTCKTYSDEVFFGKPAPVLSNVEFVRGTPAELKPGVVTVVYFFTTFYKGGFNCNEELSVLAAKFKDQVQFIAISNDPEKEKVEKLLGKIADGTCCDPITKQVYRLAVPWVGWDAGKVTTKAYANLLNTSVLHTPQAFIIDGHGNLAWRQGLLQTYKFSDSTFEAQLTAVVNGAPVQQPYGARPKVTSAGEAAEVEGEMSLF